MHGGHHQGSQRRRHKLSALARDPKFLSEQRPGRCGSETNDDAGPDERDFGIQPGPAGADLFCVRLAVNPTLSTRLPFEVLYNIFGVNLAPVDSDLIQNGIKKLTG